VFDPPPADRLDIPISECVHNLRTALDHIGYRLAIYIGGDPPPNADGTGFPICRDPKHFTASLPNRIGKLKRIPPALRTALEDAQPYAGGHGADFPTLTNLNDCDKHRFAPLLAAVAEVRSLNIGTFHGSSFVGPLLGGHEDGAVIVKFIPAPNTEVDMELRVGYDVAFGPGYPGNGAYVVSYLRGTLDYIRDTLVPSLAAFL
jgi:hypothetical protein